MNDHLVRALPQEGTTGANTEALIGVKRKQSISSY